MRSRRVEAQRVAPVVEAAANDAVCVAHRLGQSGGAGTEDEQRVAVRGGRFELPQSRSDRLVQDAASASVRPAPWWSPTACAGVVSARAWSTSRALPRRAEQHRGGAQSPDRPQRDHELGAVGRHDRHPVARRARPDAPASVAIPQANASSSGRVYCAVLESEQRSAHPQPVLTRRFRHDVNQDTLRNSVSPNREWHSRQILEPMCAGEVDDGRTGAELSRPTAR